MADANTQIDRSCRLVADEQGLREALASAPPSAVVGLDTETYWDHTANGMRLSLIQIAWPGREILVVDALSLGVEAVRPLIESASPSMVAHNARFDQGVLAGAGLRPDGLIDTLTMARASLTLQSYSLASVVEHLFGVPLDKSLRTSNWRRRPLTKAQVAYAALDARMALLVYEELKRRLEGEGRFEEVLRAATLAQRTTETVKRKKRVKQELSPPLTAEEKQVVSRLKKWRLERANTQRVPAYMICPDRTLEHLARSRPSTLEALGEVYGLGSSKITSFGEELLNALRDAYN